MSGKIPDVVANKFIDALKADKASFSTVQAAVDDLMSEGFPGISVLNALNQVSRYHFTRYRSLSNLAR